MNKKGFTLVEILAVLALLSVILIIGTVSINGIHNKIDKNLFESKLEYIINGAETWGQDNKTSLMDGELTTTVGSLIASKDIETDELRNYASCEAGNSKDGKCMVITNNVTGNVINALELRVYLENNRVYSCIIKNSSNMNLLDEDASYSKYSSLNYYC